MDTLLAFRELSERQAYESTITFNPYIEDTDQALCEIAEEIETKYKLEGNDWKKTMELIKKINETTPKSQIIKSNVTYAATKCKRRLFLKDEHEEEDGVRVITKLVRLSFKLKDLYQRLFNEQFENCHRAEGDVIALIKCCAKFGPPIIEWFENNNVKFGDIQPMYPS